MKCIYNELSIGKKFKIAELTPSSFYEFLNKINQELINKNITVVKYNEIINESFLIENTEYTPNEVFNYFVYDNDQVVKSKKVSNLILEIVKKDIMFISLDPKRLTTIIVETESDKALKHS